METTSSQCKNRVVVSPGDMPLDSTGSGCAAVLLCAREDKTDESHIHISKVIR
jgi:hypothetical protein